MRRFEIMLSCLISTFLPTVMPATAQTTQRSEHTLPGRRCGDFTILSRSSDQKSLSENCTSHLEKDYATRTSVVRRLNPKVEAMASAMRGDFRLAALVGGGPYPNSPPTSIWDAYGVVCKSITDSDVVLWSSASDSGPLPMVDYEGAMSVFAASYNRALIKLPKFPKDRSCELNPKFHN